MRAFEQRLSDLLLDVYESAVSLGSSSLLWNMSSPSNDHGFIFKFSFHLLYDF